MICYQKMVFLSKMKILAQNLIGLCIKGTNSIAINIFQDVVDLFYYYVFSGAHILLRFNYLCKRV